MSTSETWLCPECGANLNRLETCPHCVTAPATEPVSSESREFDLPGFRLERVIGAGGMGVVCVAEELALGRRVAVKTIQGDQYASSEWVERFDREARLMATVEDPNVVRVYANLESQGRRYLVMEYVEGESLAERLKRETRLPLEYAMRVTLQVAFGLRAAAARGVVHRDVKPGNILIDLRDNVRVTDFGLSRSVSVDSNDQITQEGRFVGTPTYVAPEQAEGLDVGIRADMYSLGIVLFEMVAGEAPFKGSSPLAIVAKHLHEPVPRLRRLRRDTPAALQKLVDSLTAKEPDKRPESWDEVIDQIRRIMRSWAPPVTSDELSSASITTGVVVNVVVTGVLVAVAALGTVMLMLLAVNVTLVRVFGDPAQRWMQENTGLWMGTSLTLAIAGTAAIFALTVWIIRLVAAWRP